MLKNMRLSTCRRDIGVLIVLSLLVLLSIPTQAHPPADTSLSFDQKNNTLSVAITHTVSAPSSHYVVRVDITKNDLPILSKDYTSQPSSSKFTYSYPVNASAGDVLKAKATCSIAGSRTGELTVANTTMLVAQSSVNLPLDKRPHSQLLEVNSRSTTRPTFESLQESS